MSHITLIKVPGGWANADPEAEEFHKKIKTGATIHADFKRMRNSKFHRKFFALLNLAFENWEPGEISSKHGKPEKNFDRFRSDITILAGHYHIEVRLDGSVVVAADSLKFSKMDEDTFNALYSNTIDVVLKKIDSLSGQTAKELGDIVNKVLEFV